LASRWHSYYSHSFVPRNGPSSWKIFL